MTSVITIDHPSFTSSKNHSSSSKNPTMSSSDHPSITTSTVPKSLATILAKMKKRQADTPADEPKAKKAAYTGNLRFDLKCVVISVWNSEKSERFTLIPCMDQGEMMKNDRCNGYLDDNVVRVRPDKDGDEYSESITLGEVFEVSRWHGGKPEQTPRKYKFGDSVVLKRVSMKRGDTATFNNVHWVEFATEKFPMNIPKTMKNMSEDNYHKAVVIGGEDSNVTNAAFALLKLTSSGKIYSSLSFNYGEEGQEGSAMIWEEKLLSFGCRNPELLESILPKVLETSLTIIGSREKNKEGYESTGLKLSVRAMLLGAGTLQQYVEEYGVSMKKAKVVKELGATVASDLHDEHPLNSVADTTILNLNEWTGSLANMPKSVKFYRVWDSVVFAVLA